MTSTSHPHNESDSTDLSARSSQQPGDAQATQPLPGKLGASASARPASPAGATSATSADSAAASPDIDATSTSDDSDSAAPASAFGATAAADIDAIATASIDGIAARILLDGLSRLLHFLIDEETECLCGVPRNARSAHRVNYRIGCYRRKLRTDLGTIVLRVPHLKYFHLRPSISKRARRLSADTLGSLARIHADGVTPAAAAALITTLWTLEITDERLAAYAGRLVPVLQAWRTEAVP